MFIAFNFIDNNESLNNFGELEAGSFLTASQEEDNKMVVYYKKITTLITAPSINSGNFWSEL